MCAVEFIIGGKYALKNCYFYLIDGKAKDSSWRFGLPSAGGLRSPRVRGKVGSECVQCGGIVQDDIFEDDKAGYAEEAAAS